VSGLHRLRRLGPATAVASLAVLLAAPLLPAGADQPSFKQATFADQSVKPTRLTAAIQMTKDVANPVRAFTGPTDMLASPTNPRIIVAATADLRTRVCQLVRSVDGGKTWHLSRSLPAPQSYPYCQDGLAGVAPAAIAWGRNGTLYYAAEGFNDQEGGFRSGHVSLFVSKSTDLGDTWTSVIADPNRGKPAPAATDNGASLAVDTSGPTDVVYAATNQNYPDADMNSPLNNGPVVVMVSTDAGKTFSPAQDLNKFAHLTQNINGKTYPLLMEGFFGSPILIAHKGVVMAFSHSQTPFDNSPGMGGNFGARFGYALPQLVARSTDQGKTWTMAALGPPVFDASGSQTGVGWTPKGGAQGTYLAAYQATPTGAQSSGPAQVVVQRSTDGGVTWTDPVAIDDDNPSDMNTSFYPQMGVAPNGRVDVVWQDSRNLTDFHFNVRYTYSTDGGATWAHNMLVSDRPLDFNHGVSFNSDLRMPPGVASANQYAWMGWADSRLANDTNQTQDNFGAGVQFASLPTTKNTTLPKVAAVFGGLLLAGLILLVLYVIRRGRGGTPTAPEPAPREPASVT
jgi:hypothetical protein